MRRRLAALAVLPLLLTAAACGGADDSTGQAGDSPSASSSTGSDETGGDSADSGDAGSVDGVEVSGPVGEEPQVTIDAPLEIDGSTTEVVTSGDGSPVVEGNQALISFSLYNGRTGEQVFSTWKQGAPYHLQTVSDDQFFPVVIDAIIDQPAGSRVVVAASPEDAFGSRGNPQMGIEKDDPVVFVVDIASVEPTDVLDGPQGTPVKPPADAPTVVEKDGKVTKLDFSSAAKKPPKKLQVIPLIKGDGPEVTDDSLVTFNYLGQVYGTDKVFDESYSREPVTFPLGVGGLIKGWDEGLVGLTRGSRVLVIAPPEYGYGSAGNPQAGIKGTDTLAFVVDILGVDQPS
ncbi:MAG TPA: FKBP-type peptidyl-prolyl cis-trans isomerase [Nocardioidaceae bacterium]|nr:FKBP-type peptidyl-prolyl cis-trans isomerase [Nocardioidaceae bacterium]